jgi:hypothetical protein
LLAVLVFGIHRNNDSVDHRHAREERAGASGSLSSKNRRFPIQRTGRRINIRWQGPAVEI